MEAIDVGKPYTVKVSGPISGSEYIKRLKKQVLVLRKANFDLKNRYIPCPDHRDKHSTGDECLMCQLERVKEKNARLESIISNMTKDEFE